MLRRGRRSNGWILRTCVGAALACVATLAVAAVGEAERWQALFAAVPALPATPRDAATKISARMVLSEGLGIHQLRIEVADPDLRTLQQQVDRLYEPLVKAGAAHMQRVMEAANEDPAVAKLARQMDQVWQQDPANPDKLPSPEALRKLDRDIARVLGPTATAASAAATPRTEIGAYRFELQRNTPRAPPFMQRMLDQQRHYAQQHATVDREALAQLAGTDVAAAARAVVARHHALAQQQLVDAAVILSEARATLTPRVARLTELARAAEQRGAPPHERNQAYVMVKGYIEHLLTLQRETLQDVGFWGGMRVTSILPSAAQANARSLYEQSLAPGFELRANGEQPYSLPYYPLGRAIVVGLPQGIR